MSASTSSTLATLLADPERISDVPVADVPALIGEAEALRARLWARLQAGEVVRRSGEAPERSGSADRLLSADEAAERLGVSRRWMYRKADALPFTRRLSGGTLRFSEKGLNRWQEARR